MSLKFVEGNYYEEGKRTSGCQKSCAFLCVISYNCMQIHNYLKIKHFFLSLQYLDNEKEASHAPHEEPLESVSASLFLKSVLYQVDVPDFI